jgi:DNA-directed RNA polymerase subunit H (RpoH/RPB5)
VPPGEYLVSTNPMFMIEGKDPDAKSVTVKVGDVVDVTVTEYSRGD